MQNLVQDTVSGNEYSKLYDMALKVYKTISDTTLESMLPYLIQSAFPRTCERQLHCFYNLEGLHSSEVIPWLFEEVFSEGIYHPQLKIATLLTNLNLDSITLIKFTLYVRCVTEK